MSASSGAYQYTPKGKKSLSAESWHPVFWHSRTPAALLTLLKQQFLFNEKLHSKFPLNLKTCCCKEVTGV